MISIKWDYDAWEEYIYWQNNDKKCVDRINLLIKDTCRDPFNGLGKPEALKGNLSGTWSRRITSEHRLVYYISVDTIVILSCKDHYNH